MRVENDLVKRLKKLMHAGFAYECRHRLGLEV